MSQDGQDFEIIVKGHTLVKVSDESVRVNGKDFHSDLRSLDELIGILSQVVETARGQSKLRMAAVNQKGFVPPRSAKSFPYRVISNT